MMMRIIIAHVCCIQLAAGLLSKPVNEYHHIPGLQAAGSFSVYLMITHMMGSQRLVREQAAYINPSGETFTIARFRYFLSNFSLETSDGKIVRLTPAYFLVDDAIDSSRLIRLENIPAGTYKNIRFLIGVDSLRNVSGVQPGALAPETGMFWTWNSGYIMAQMEGYAAAVATPTHQFFFHVGGYKASDQVLKYVTLTFPQPLLVAEDKQPRVSILADAGKWFTPTNISFKQIPGVMAPGPAARKLAANYQDMFTVKSILY